jgi:BMFP domain-containing protein YqiC
MNENDKRADLEMLLAMTQAELDTFVDNLTIEEFEYVMELLLEARSKIIEYTLDYMESELDEYSDDADEVIRQIRNT